jgi:hypothetical protein
VFCKVDGELNIIESDQVFTVMARPYLLDNVSKAWYFEIADCSLLIFVI